LKRNFYKIQTGKEIKKWDTKKYAYYYFSEKLLKLKAPKSEEKIEKK